ncbi:MAG: MarC family protein [Phycisphaerae bacterium]
MLDSAFSFIAILNPFALCLYVGGIIDDVNFRNFTVVLLRACAISLGAFIASALGGEFFLTQMLNIRPEAMRTFGGIIFLIAGYNYVMKGYRAAEMLRGSLEELPSAIALPFMIGAGSITQAILVGKQHTMLTTTLILTAGVVFSFLVIIGFAILREHMKASREAVFERYVNILARLNGLVIGAISVQMIVNGVHELWLEGPTTLPAG